jgi:hypothetical protein
MSTRTRGLMFTCLAALTALSGCRVPAAAEQATPYPPDYVPTAVYLTALAIDSATQTASPPTLTATVTSTFIPPTIAPTDTPTPGPRVPLAALEVRAPGPMSRIVSPLQVQLVAISGASNRVEIGLFGEDGRLLGRTLIAVAGSPAGDPLSIKIPFEIRAVAENGFVQVSTRTTRGKIQSLITVPVLLLSSGESQINPAGNTIYEHVALADLPPKSDIFDGELEIDGEILPYNNQPVIMELLTETGETLSLRVLNLSGKDWQTVHTTLPYRVGAPTPARLFISQIDDVIDGPAYVYSQALNLNP